MIRALVFGLAFMVLGMTGIGQAEKAQPWIKLTSVEIDPRTAGTKTVELPGGGTGLSAIRLEADRAVTFVRVESRTDAGQSGRIADVKLVARTPSQPVYSGKPAGAVKSIELAWAADPAATGPVTVTISGQRLSDTLEAKPSPEGGGNTRGIGSAGPKSAPPKSAEARPAPPPPPVVAAPAPEPAKPAPGADASPKPEAARPPAPTDGRPRTGAARGEALPNVCTSTAVCTVVDVFFGTDRNKVVRPERISFGAERPNKLTLGHAFVTVPKANRKVGEIPLPTLWDKYVRGVPPEGDPARHFTIPKNGVVVYSTEAEFLAAAKTHMQNAGSFKNHAFVFVHGFYVTFENALYRTAQIAYDLSPDGRPFGTAFLYTWPSAGNATAYVYDQDSAQFSVPHLVEFLRLVTEKTGVENVHVIAHSMGNVPLIGALQEFARVETKAKINQIILAAPDVDKQQFETVIRGVERVAKGMTLYASQGDKALAIARNIRGGTARAGETLMPPGPAIVSGIDTIDVSGISTAALWGHDTYADSTELLADIARIFTGGDRPPSKRSPNFKLLQQGTLQYWKYAK